MNNEHISYSSLLQTYVLKFIYYETCDIFLDDGSI